MKKAVIPANAGIQSSNNILNRSNTWIPAFAGMTMLLLGLVPIFAEEIDTVIKGASMELKDQGERVVFSGHVKLTRGPDILKARVMETTKRRDRVTAKGDVELLRVMNETQKIKGYGSRGFYDTESGQGYLLGGDERGHIIYSEVVSSTVTRVFDIYADRFDFSQTSSTGLATGNVYGKSIDPVTNDIFEFWSESAAYDAAEKKIILTGKSQPRVRQMLVMGNRTIDGNMITYFYESRKFSSVGAARAVFVDAKKRT